MKRYKKKLLMGLKGTIHLNFADPLLVKMTCLVHNGTFFYTFQCTIAKKNDLFSRQKTRGRKRHVCASVPKECACVKGD